MMESQKTTNKEFSPEFIAGAKYHQVEKMLRAYFGPEPYEENIIDILADIMHYCKVENIDFNDSLRIAQGHFEAEVDGIY
jgi:hypothetical protein